MIENKINNKKYIGQTVDFEKRIDRHYHKLKGNRHDNEHLQNSFNKYGANVFRIILLEDEVDKEDLDEREIYYINKFNTYKGKGYNMTSGGDSVEFTDEVVKKIKESKVGDKNPNYGKTLEEMHKEGCKCSFCDHSQISGENNKFAKISIDEGKEIFNKYHNEGVKVKELSKIYPLSRNTISKIIYCNHYSTRDLSYDGLKGTYKVTKELGEEIYKEYKNTNKSQYELADMYNLHRSTIQKIVTGNHWTTKGLKE